MKKDDLIKIFVLAVVAAFILGLFSFRGDGTYGDQPPSGTPSPTPQGGLFGTAEVEGTVASYPDSVLTLRGVGAGSDEALGKRLNGLVREGQVSYINTAGGDSLNLILPAGADVASLALNLTLDFPYISTSAKAQFALPERITFRVAGGNITAGTSRRPLLVVEPLVPVGGSIQLLIGAILDRDGAPATDMQVSVAELEGTAMINATVQELDEGWSAQAAYAWESRRVDEAGIGAKLKAAYPGSSFEYHSNPFILLDANATEEQAAELQNLSYVNLVIGRTVLVDPEFIAREQAAAEFKEILNSTGLSFPDSYAEFNATSGEPGLGLVEGIFSGALWVETSRTGWVSLGSNVTIDGREYVLPGGASFITVLPANASAGDSFEMPFVVEISGPRVISVRAGS